MRSSTRSSLFVLVIGLWITSCAIVLVSVLVAPPARGQPKGGAWWSPEEDDRRYPQGYGELRVVESAGEVVMKFTTEEPGRTEYYTRNGDCGGYPTAEDPANPFWPDECGRPYARAGEDYGAVRGQWTFTEAGSRTIRIPIFDDDRDETDREPFTIHADHKFDSWPVGGVFNAWIYIEDDDPRNVSDASPAEMTTVRPAYDRPAGTRPAATAPPATSSDAGNQSDVNPGDRVLEGERSAGDEAEAIAADTLREDKSIPMASLRALLFVLIAAASFALRKKFVRKKT